MERTRGLSSWIRFSKASLGGLLLGWKNVFGVGAGDGGGLKKL